MAELWCAEMLGLEVRLPSGLVCFPWHCITSGFKGSGSLGMQGGDAWLCTHFCLTAESKLYPVSLDASLEKLHAFVCPNKNEQIDSHFNIISQL